jgi:hypothetical protein
LPDAAEARDDHHHERAGHDQGDDQGQQQRDEPRQQRLEGALDRPDQGDDEQREGDGRQHPLRGVQRRGGEDRGAHPQHHANRAVRRHPLGSRFSCRAGNRDPVSEVNARRCRRRRAAATRATGRTGRAA